MKKSLIVLFAAAALLSACNKEEASVANVNDSTRTVKFSMENLYQFNTKAEMAPSGVVGVYAYTAGTVAEGGANAAYTITAMPTTEPAAAGTLSGTGIKWGVEQMGTNTATDFFAMYPREATDQRNAFSPSTDLAYSISNTEESVAYAKDFMVAYKSEYPGADTENPRGVAFNFQHPFAMLRYVITNSSDDAIKEVWISGVHVNGDLDYTTAAITATGEAETQFYLVKESEVGNVLTYYCIIVPEAGINPTITVKTWSNATSTYALTAAQNFVAGNRYTANITYDFTHSAASSNRTMTATFNVTDWAGETVVTPGAGSTPTGSDDWPYIRGNNISGIADWDEPLAMSCVGPNSYRKVITLTAAGAFKIFKSESNTWLGKTGNGDTSVGNEWTKWTTGGDDVPISAGTHTIYFYYDNNQIWVHAGDVTM